MVLERDYQSDLIKRLRVNFPGCVVLKNDTDYMQGVPDLTLLYKKNWAMLEVKRSERAPIQPNQDYYIELANELSFGSFIYPENEEDVFNAIREAFKSRRSSRVPQR